MDVSFPYKEAITNAYGSINHTTTNVANQSPLTVLEEKTKQRSVNQLYFMVKEVFEAVHFDTRFNPIVGEAAE